MCYICKISSVNDLLTALPYVSDDFTRNMLLHNNHATPLAHVVGAKESRDHFTHETVALHTREGAISRSSVALAVTPWIGGLVAAQPNSFFGRTDRVGRYWVTNKTESLFDEKEPMVPPYHEELHEVHPTENMNRDTDVLEAGDFILSEDFHEESKN